VKVIFACVHNAGRSQMAAAFFNQYAENAHAISAGTEPADCVHPCVVDAMNEVGIDLAAVKPQKLTDQLASQANVLITMGCGESCPFVPGLKREDWAIPDPKGKSVEDVRAIRDEILNKVMNLIREANELASPRAGG